MYYDKLLEDALAGKNIGLSTGLTSLDKAIGGVQQGKMYGLFSPPKTGKSTIADFSFIFNPYWDSIKKGKKYKVYYFSLEVSLRQKVFDFLSFLMYTKHNITSFEYEGKKIKISPDYYSGRLFDDNGIIKPSEEHINLMREIFHNELVDILGEYDTNGKLIKEGIVKFITRRMPVESMRKRLNDILERHGEVTYYGSNKQLQSFKPYDEEEIILVIVDHIRLIPSIGKPIKQTLDDWIDISVEYRNRANLSFLQVTHSNRAISNPERIKMGNKRFLVPNRDDLKDSGNLSEACNYLLSLFDPSDPKYGITQIRDYLGTYDINQYKNFRVLSLVDARNAPFPRYIPLQLQGGIKNFKTI